VALVLNEKGEKMTLLDHLGEKISIWGR